MEHLQLHITLSRVENLRTCNHYNIEKVFTLFQTFITVFASILLILKTLFIQDQRISTASLAQGICIPIRDKYIKGSK